MKRTLATLVVMALSSAGLSAAPQDDGLFHPPTLVKAGGKPVRVDAPGYAAPCWQDLDGDGLADLLVGQFRDGKVKVYRGQKDGTLAAGTWLMAGGDVAEIPGVW